MGWTRLGAMKPRATLPAAALLVVVVGAIIVLWVTGGDRPGPL